ncbi:MAG TPA: DUF4112 domain-containing protein [Caulobacteraceae bacterium]|nr:DUF4112 domain-containing protein [Caulobacteraceae bacterium]
MATRDPDLEAIRRSVLRIGTLSDGLIHFGPFGIGLDGILDWIPGAGEIYSVAAGAFLIVQGLRAKVPIIVLVIAAALMAMRALITALPLAGPPIADLFLAHRWAARLIARAIERRIERERAFEGWVAPARG